MAPSRDKILREAEKLVQKGKVEQAIREYEKLLKKNPNDANTINRVGDLYGRVGQVDKAVELYERIAEHFTQDGFTTKAIAILKKINRLAPQRLDIFDRLADLYLQQGLMVEAKSQYQILADWYIKSGDQGKAVDIHRKLVQIDPNNHMAHLRLADLLMQGGEVSEALGVYDQLGQVLLERNKLDEAERLYRHALDQDPPEGEFLAPLCDALLEAGRTATAREFLQAASQRSEDSPVLRLIEVRTHLAFGESDDALTKARAALQERPDDSEIRCLVARALLSTGEVAEARNTLLPASEQLTEQGDFAAAQKLLHELLGALPNDQEVLNLALRAYRPSGDQEMIRKISVSLADSCYSDENFEQAQHLYTELLRSDPNNDLFRQRLAVMQGVQPDEIVVVSAEEEAVVESDVGAEPAVEVAQQPEEAGEPAAVQDSADAEFDPEERLAEAKEFAKYGLVEKATAHLEQIIRVHPDEIEARAILVSLYVEQGEMAAALPVARELFESYRAAGDGEAMDALLVSFPDLAPEEGLEEVEEIAELVADEDDELIVVDLDEELAQPEEVEAAAAGHAEEEGVVFDEPSPLESDDDALVIDLDAVDASSPATQMDAGVADVVSVDVEDGGVTALSEEDVDEVTEAEMLEQKVSQEHAEVSDRAGGPPSEDLAQLDSFIDHDLHEDAIRLLGRLENDFPGSAEVAERRLELKAKGVLLEDVVAVQEEPEELFADEEESYVDLAKELELEMAEEEAMVDEATGRGKEEALLEEVFKEFQKGVEEQLSEADSDTHFNLGIAYKEMGLLPEAIREFQVSSRDPGMFVESCSMIGVCYVEQGMWSQAAEWYRKALEMPDLAEEARLALRYDLASTLASSGENDQAVSLFEEIAAADPAYRDVTARLSSLSNQRQVN
jgi:tetratricopeptide (TPR) repeat protein